MTWDESMTVQAILRSEILDQDTCEVCADVLDGVVLAADDPAWGGEMGMLAHPNCFIDPQTPIYTEHGWRGIGKITEGDLVLTHRGRFRKVRKVYRSQEKYNGEVIKIVTCHKNKQTSITVTPEHPVLTISGWCMAKDITENHKLVWLGKLCPVCNGFIPMLPASKYPEIEYCGHSCMAKLTIPKMWNRAGFRERMSKKTSEQMINDYRSGKRNGKTIIKNAHKKVKELIKDGKFVLQRPDVQLKAHRILAQTKYNTYLEKKMEWLLKNMNIPYEKQFIVYRKEKRSNGNGLQRRFYKTDFALPQHKIVIECDGDFWHKDIKKDEHRQTEIESYGWTFLRFAESDIKNNLNSCSNRIKRVLMNHNHQYLFSANPVVDIQKWNLRQKRTLYNLMVNEDKSFIANGIVVHNCRMVLVPLFEGIASVMEPTPIEQLREAVRHFGTIMPREWVDRQLIPVTGRNAFRAVPLTLDDLTEITEQDELIMMLFGWED